MLHGATSSFESASPAEGDAATYPLDEFRCAGVSVERGTPWSSHAETPLD
jgi:hypothetical protein